MIKISFFGLLFLLSTLANNDTEQHTGMIKRSVFDIYFDGNEENANSALHQLFKKLDSDQNGQITESEYADFGKSKIDSLEEYISGMFFRYDRNLKKNFFNTKLDKNQTGKLSEEQFVAIYEDEMKSNEVLIPQNLTAVCESVEKKVFSCMESENAGLLISMCYSGVGWLLQKHSFESCILENHNFTCEDKDSLKVCQKNYHNNYDYALQKRFYGEFALALPALISPIVIILSLITMSVIGSVSSRNRFNSWDNAVYYRWKIGAPEPPCGTVMVFWNEKCHLPFTKRANTCERGIPYHKQACGLNILGWGRSCGFGGCQLLCMDVSAHDCSVPISPPMYNEKGIAIPGQ